MAFKQTTPGKVLLLTIMNDIYSLNCFTIHKVCFLFVYLLENSVSDPDSLSLDPDPAF
jgi:hypothetical protein